MSILVFDVKGDYAYFRIPEGTRANYSFPFPPRTALIGLIAAILGQPRNEYWNDDRFQEIRVGLQILSFPKTYPVKMNYWRTKTPVSLGKGLSLLLPSDHKSRGYTTQLKIEYLQDVAYRVYCHLPDEDLHSELYERLQHRKYYYPPVLGHNNLLAEIDLLGAFNYDYATVGKFTSLIPLSAVNLEKLPLTELGNYKLYYSVPQKYVAEKQEHGEFIYWKPVPSKYDTILLPPEDGVQVVLKEGYGYSVLIDGKKEMVCLT